MSRLETPITRAYWRRVGGTLVEEFPLVQRGGGHAPRWIDALIFPNGEHRIAKASEVEIDGADVIVVQTKAGRLGMYLMGQAVFSRQLMLTRFTPASVRSIALCTRDDAVLRPLLLAFPGVEIVIMEKGEGLAAVG